MEIPTLYEPAIGKTLKSLNKKINSNEKNLKEGFSLAYLSLLKSIASQDLSEIQRICEGNLSKVFTAGLKDISPQIEKIQITNEEDFP